jgi:hypothetical protein
MIPAAAIRRYPPFETVSRFAAPVNTACPCAVVEGLFLVRVEKIGGGPATGVVGVFAGSTTVVN